MPKAEEKINRRGSAEQPYIPYVVLAVSFCLTMLAAGYVRMAIEERDLGQFENASQSTLDTIQDRLRQCVTLLRGGAGLFAGSESVSLKDFSQFAEALRLDQNFPGVQGVGYAVRVRRENLETFEAWARAEGVSSTGRDTETLQPFKVFPDDEREEYFPIIYLEPRDRRNMAAIGYDMFTEPVRRAAMEQARDTGRSVASGRVTLVQEIDEDKQPGFLIYVAVYDGGTTPATVEERREKLLGFIYSPFRAHDLFGGIFGSETDPRVHFSLYESPAINPAGLLYSSKLQDERGRNHEPRYQEVMTLGRAVGRDWGVVIESRMGFETGADRHMPAYILSGGGLVSLALFWLTRLQAKARLAAERTNLELMRSQEALQHGEERYRSLVEASSQMIWRTDADGEPAADMPAWYQMTGQSREATHDMGWLQAIHPDDREPTIALWNQARAQGTPYDAEFRVSDRSGEYRILSVHGVPVRNRDGSVREWIGTCSDITDQRRAERERAQWLEREQEARREAEAANRLKDEFLATVSHELRTPLNAILGWAQLLRVGGMSVEETRQAVETIERNARAQAQLVEDLLDVSRIVSGKLRLEVRPISLVEVVVAAMESIRPAAEARGIRLVSRIADSAPQVLGDASRLQQVAWNLLSNAVKFTARGGEVHVELGVVDPGGGDVVRLLVRDTGRGIAPEFLPYVFNAFRQAEASTTRTHGGLGLGLAIVRHLVELHGGSVRAESDGVGLGSSFIVELPTSRSNPAGDINGRRANPSLLHASAATNDPPAESRRLAGLKVLVVDDEPDARTLISHILRKGGAEVFTVDSAEAALAALQRDPPDVLLSDIGMPGADGYALIERVRGLPAEQGGRVPAVALTAFARMEDRRRAMRAGYQAHLSKPVDPDELTEAIAALGRT